MFHEKEHISKEQTAYLRRTQKRKAAVWLLQVLLLILFFLLWEIAADCGWIDPFLFSQPTELFATAVKMIRDGSLFLHIGTTLRETVIGFLLGTILGTLTAVLLWWNRFISDVAEPYLVVLNSLPKTALAPIIIVWFGNNQSSIIIVALLTSIVVTILSVLNGFLQVDEDQIKLIRIFGGTKRHKGRFPCEYSLHPQCTENQCRAFLCRGHRRGISCRTGWSGLFDCLFLADLRHARSASFGCHSGNPLRPNVSRHFPSGKTVS